MSDEKKLRKELEKVEKNMGKASQNVRDYALSAPRSQKRWKNERLWDYWAGEKRRVQDLLDQIKDGGL